MFILKQLWDICSSKKCPYFVVSVYDCWIFGVFVKGIFNRLSSKLNDPILHRLDNRPHLREDSAIK